MASHIDRFSFLNQPQVSDRLMYEFIAGNTMAPFMGTSKTSYIYIEEDYMKGQGDTKIFTLLDELRNNYFLGREKMEGLGEDIKSFTDTLTVHRIRNNAKFEDRVMNNVREVSDFESKLLPMLRRLGQRDLRDNIIDALTDVTRGRHHTRYMYGTNPGNYDVDHALACANVGAGDEMSIEMLRQAKIRAVTGQVKGVAGKARRIQSGEMKMEKGTMQEYFVAILTPQAALQLKNDPLYENLALYHRDAGAGPRLIDNHRYLGQFEGIFIYEVDEMCRAADGSPVKPLFDAAHTDHDPNLAYTRLNLETAGASGVALTHSVLMGAQAMCMGYAQKPTVSTEDFDHGSDIEIGITQVYGVKKTTYDNRDGAGKVDHAVVHMITAA